MKIRPEEQKDHRKVEELLRNSFWNIYRPGAYEHFIVHNLRNDESHLTKLAYVTEDDGNIIASINYSIGTINCKNKSSDGVILGPVAVDKNRQGNGIGSKLIEHTLKIAQKDGIPFVLVVGDENYYSRFGFERASKYNLHLENTSPDEENPFFMIKIFDESQISFENGVFHNPDAFHVDETEVDEFDRQFEYREKLVKEGQLGV